MRRLSSIFISAAVAISGLTLTSTVASAAGGTATIKRSANTAPASISGASAMRTIRLSKTNQLLAIGRDASVSAAHYFIWKINEDATIDASFGAVDLGANSAAPTASNSTCVANNNNNMNCDYLDSMIVNEFADRYTIFWTRQLNGSGQSNYSNSVGTITVGKISTGEVLASTNYMQGTTNIADWSQYSPIEIAQTSCTAATGSTFNGVALDWYWVQPWSTTIRPDGSFLLNFECQYSNAGNGQLPTSVTEYNTNVLAAYKVSGSAVVADTSFGTNGTLVTFNDTNACNMAPPNSSFNSGITSNTSTAVFMPYLLTLSDRTTTVPSWMSSQGVTSYSGCDMSGPSVATPTTKLLAIQANGVIKNTTTYPSGVQFYINRWIIDPQGRWNGTAMIMGQQQQTPTTMFIRLLADGKPDTSIGANGMKELTGLPTSISVNGTTIPMNYFLTGFATTAKGIVFSGMSTYRSSSGGCQNNQGVNDFYTIMYPYYFSIENGLDTTYGTNGLGEGVRYENSRTETCGTSYIGRTTFVNSKGQISFIGQVNAVGSQTRGVISVSWDAPTGVTGGGDGNGGAAAPTSAAGRVDKKVYSTKLPKATQADSALTVLTAKQAKSLDIRTSTPKVCIALTTSVVMVNPGRCTVRIVDEATQKVVRRMTTVVKKTEVEDGTILTTDKPVYFRQAKTRLSKAAKAQVAELAEVAKDAARIVVVGHSAALGEVSKYSYAISRNRANAVKAALVKAGVKIPIEVVAMAYSQPEKTAKTEKAQALNRRAEVYIFPK